MDLFNKFSNSFWNEEVSAKLIKLTLLNHGLRLLHDHSVFRDNLHVKSIYKSSKIYFRNELRFGFPRTSVGKTSSQEAEKTSSMLTTDTFCGRSPSPLSSSSYDLQSKGKQSESRKTSSTNKNQLITLDVKGNNSISIYNIASMINIHNSNRNSFDLIS